MNAVIAVPIKLAVTITTTLVSNGVPAPPGWQAMLLPDVHDAEMHAADDICMLAVASSAAKPIPLTITMCDDEKPRLGLSALLTTGAVRRRHGSEVLSMQTRSARKVAGTTWPAVKGERRIPSAHDGAHCQV